MEFVIILALVGLVVAGDYYKYDPAIVSQLVENPRLMSAHADCFLGVGSCTREAAEAKKLMPEAIETACGKCTEEDKKNAVKVVKAVRKFFPDKYEALLKLNDPEGKNRAKFEEFQKKYSS